MRRSNLSRATTFLALVSVAGCNKLSSCGHKSGALASASASAAASVAAAAAPTLPTIKPSAAPRPTLPPIASEPAPAGPLAAGDPIFQEISSAQPFIGGQAQSFRELGVHWSTPPGWITEDYVPKEGRPREKRRTSRHPNGNAYFDILEANLENQRAFMWKQNENPPIGLKPDPGPEQHDWVPFASVTLGKQGAVGSHYSDAKYTYVWIFFVHPRTKTPIQVILTWASTDAASRKALASMAASITAD